MRIKIIVMEKISGKVLDKMNKDPHAVSITSRNINISGNTMKAIFIGNNKFREIELIEPNRYEDYLRIMDEFRLMESPVIHFSAGDSKIKEVLIKKEPTYSV